MGIYTERMNGLAWVLSGTSVAIAGGLLVNFWPVEPNVGLLFTMIAFATVAVVGGFDSIQRAFVVGVIIGLIVYIPPVWDALSDFVGVQTVTLHGFKYTFVYLIYFLIMVPRPRGAFRMKAVKNTLGFSDIHSLDLAMVGLVLVSLLVFPALPHSSFAMATIIQFLMFLLYGMGWNTIGGYAGQVDLGKAQYNSIGAYTTAVMVVRCWDAPFWGFPCR